MTGDHNQRVLDALLRRMDADKKGTNHAGGNGHAISPTATTDTVPDETIIEKMRGAANAPKFATLFDDGDIRAYDDDESSADLALLSILAFYTQDVVQLDRLYRSSALMRPKWERYDYRKRTTEEALADLDETFDWTRVCATKDTDFVSSKIMTDLLDETNSDSSTSPRTHGPEEGSLPFKTAREIAETTPEKTSWVCYPWFAQATITEISGPIKKAGKTTFAAHACRNILDGASFMGGATKKTGVAYLTEQAPNSFRKVVTDAGLEARKDFHVLYWQDVRGFEWSDLMRRICDQAEELGVGLIVVDVLSRWVGGTEDENSATYALNAMTPLKEAT